MSNQQFVAITGSAGGLGVEFTTQFIKKGFQVIGIDINQDKLSKMEDHYKGHFHSYTCDISKQDNLLKVCNEIYQHFGVPKYWFNNAGIAYMKSFSQISPEEFDETININLMALVNATRFWIEKMEEKKEGTIVNLSSIAGHVPSPVLTSYTTSKFAIVGFTQSVQLELEMKKSTVKLVLVTPGLVETNIKKAGEKEGCVC